MGRISIVTFIALLPGCTSPSDSSDLPRPMLSGDGFFDSPWPSDLRTDEAGHADLTGFPGTGSIAILDTYVQAAGALEGFSNNAPIYFRFEGPIDTSRLPTPAESTGFDSPVMLLDIDPDSPTYTRITPIAWDYKAVGDKYEPQDLLEIAPVWGFPLRPATRYAALVREPIAQVTDEFRTVWDDDDPAHADWEPLQQALRAIDVDEDSVAAATIFTTQDPLEETASYADYIQNRLPLPALEPSLIEIERFDAYTAYEGWIWVPLWQEGERPYATTGGGLHHNEAGEPSPYTWEYIRFSLTIPRNADEPPDGWPLVMVSHGTGGDYMNYAYPGYGTTPANMLARRGIAGLGVDQPLSGCRATPDTNVELHTFNFMNPDSARAVLRQAALDMVYLATVFSAETRTFTLPAGRTVRIDPTRMAFLGHSQGGLTGALAGPWLGRDLRAMALSGAGGGLSITVVERKQDLDAQALLAGILGVETEDVDTFHPVVGLLQWIVDVTDTINYAPYYYSQEPPWDGAPIDLVMTEGLLDTYTPPRTTEALAASARVPFLDPVYQASDAQTLRNLAPVARPASGDAFAWDGTATTAGLAQYPNNDHFAIYDNMDAARTWVDFIESALVDETPTIGK